MDADPIAPDSPLSYTRFGDNCFVVQRLFAADEAPIKLGILNRLNASNWVFEPEDLTSFTLAEIESLYITLSHFND
jgi:hypothetical protein